MPVLGELFVTDHVSVSYLLFRVVIFRNSILDSIGNTSTRMYLNSIYFFPYVGEKSIEQED